MSTPASPGTHDGLVATPIIFGTHRKPEGVVLLYTLIERLLPAIDDVLLAETVRARINSSTESIPLTDVIDERGFSPGSLFTQSSATTSGACPPPICNGALRSLADVAGG